MSSLEGRVAIVTGSSSGIGQATAQHLASLGARVVVNSASSVEAGQEVAASLEIPSIYVQADISDPEDRQRLIDSTLERLGRLDVLVNNAGWTAFVDHNDLDALTDEIFRKTFEVNVFGTWSLTKLAIPHLSQSPDGNVVTVTSVAGIRPAGSSIAYAMSKAALNHMTRLLAKSFGPVRVNAVAPGLIETPWTSNWDNMHDLVAEQAPARRSGKPEEIALAVGSLVTNGYVTGEVLVVDGGLTQVL
ncbi:MAG TPA: glucose 1-dehydrogenase [Acidimicrobiia bacterium]|nr:glucose 1-dehydrogenase [Acidimicrobiia bacterium]